MAQFEVYFDTIFPSENSRNLHLLHKNNAIVAKPYIARESGKRISGAFGVNLIKVCFKSCYCSH